MASAIGPLLIALLFAACTDLPAGGWPLADLPRAPAGGQEPGTLNPAGPGAVALPGAAPQPRPARSFDSFAGAAARARADLILPWFEETPAQVAERARSVTAETARALDAIARTDPARADFRSIFVALDDAWYAFDSVAQRLTFMRETQPDAAMREACAAAVEEMERARVSLVYRADVYARCAEFAAAYARGERPGLRGEDLRLFEETMRDLQRLGFGLEPAARAELQALHARLSDVAQRFSQNVTAARAELRFTSEQLAGVSASFLAATRQADGSHLVRAHVVPDATSVLGFAQDEAVRRSVAEARSRLAMDENGPLLHEMLRLRHAIATRLGRAHWADHRLEPLMAGNGARALDFVTELIAGLEPKFRAELAALSAIEAEETGREPATPDAWDVLYLQNRLAAREFGVDAAELRHYFPLERVLEGMFLTFEHLFGLRFHPITPNRPWVEDLRLYVVEDARSLEPLGAFYLDLFPREGKYGHFAQFDLVTGKRLPDGRMRRPVAALVCNFTPPAPGEPALLAHSEVETLFHEFGHCLHAVLSRAEHARFSGGAVPRDFVEAPSQMFEAWAWDPQVLSIFAGHWKDPSRALPLETLEALARADLAAKGAWYRRQLGFALADLRLHSGAVEDPALTANRALAEAFLPPPPGTHFAAGWGHLTGYDACYYGYAWADVIAADLTTAFAEAPEGLLDAEVGMRLRREIYERGGTRPAADSVRAFLGRPSDARAFLRALGIGD